MKRIYTILIYALSDALFVGLAFYAALMLRYDFNIPIYMAHNIIVCYPMMTSAFLLVSLVLGCYDEIIQYTGFYELLKQIIAVTILAFVLYIMQAIGVFKISGSVIIMMACLLFMFTGGSRSLPRVLMRFQMFYHIRLKQAKRVLIVGAGNCGAMLIKKLMNNSDEQLYPVACVDDDPAKKFLRICGVKVMGTTHDIVKIVRKNRIDAILIAIPSADTKTIRSIYENSLPAGVPIRLFQRVIDIEKFMKGNRAALKEVSLEDLLCRESVKTDSTIAKTYIRNKIVLVTGGAGSIGSEICRQALENDCQKLLIFDINENGLFDLNEELKQKYPLKRYELLLGSIRDKKRLDDVFAQYKPQLVFHAAAHKHVPLSEINPFEVVKNNVFGTKNVIESCKKFRTQKLILISTDKAVNPANVMGASKRLAEMLVQSENSPQTEMAAVRFGNVLGSKGSVVPIFKKQIAMGGPVTVTHPDMTRYFMTIPEAVSLVQTAAALAHGGETFVLNMGEPVKIVDMAEDLIRLSGLEPGRDIEIEFTGLRDGEKLFEELSLDTESVDTTSHNKIFIMHSSVVDEIKLHRDLASLKDSLETEKSNGKIRDLLFNAIMKEAKPQMSQA